MMPMPYPSPVSRRYYYQPIYPLQPYPIPSQVRGETSRSRIEAGLQQGFDDARMHSVATVLMGIGCLLMNLIPGLRMRWGMALRMAIANMGLMVLINVGLGFTKGFQGKAHSM